MKEGKIMKEFPDKLNLDIMWTVATSTSIETGTRPQYGFAKLLYDYLADNDPYGLCDDFKRKESTSKET
jgi:hypothetical protein